MTEKQLSNPAYLAGKLHFWEGVPSDAINHCSPEVKAAWISGWRKAESEHMQLRASLAGNRRGVSTIAGAVSVQ